MSRKREYYFVQYRLNTPAASYLLSSEPMVLADAERLANNLVTLGHNPQILYAFTPKILKDAPAADITPALPADIPTR